MFTTSRFWTEHRHGGDTSILKSIFSLNRYESELSSHEMTNGFRLGLGSYTDMTCLGRYARIIEVLQHKT